MLLAHQLRAGCQSWCFFVSVQFRVLYLFFGVFVSSEFERRLRRSALSGGILSAGQFSVALRHDIKATVRSES
jgi:hypothetical protein